MALFVLLATTARSQDFSQDGLYYKVLSADDKTCELTQRPTGSEDECGTNVTIPATITNNGVSYSVVEIGSGAFDNCNIRTITIPSSINKIDDDAFSVKGYIPSIYIERSTPPKTSEYAFAPDFSIEGNVTAYIPKGSLNSYKNSIWGQFKLVGFNKYEMTLDGLTFQFNPSSNACTLTNISGYNKKIYIPKAVPFNGRLYTVAVSDFKDNLDVSTSLLVIPNTTTTITNLNYLYNNPETSLHRRIRNIVMPSCLTMVDNVFFNSYELDQIFMQSKIPPFVNDSSEFEMGISCSTILNVPKGTLEAYRNAPGWKHFERIREKEFVSPADEQFSDGILNFTVYSETDNTCEVTGYNSDSITGHVDVPSYVLHNGTTYKVISIGPEAFYDTGLTSITLPKTLRCIASYAFAYCHDLASIDIPDSVTSIGGDSFLDCGHIETITLGKSVTRIAGDAFVVDEWLGHSKLYCLKNVYVKNPTPPRMVPRALMSTDRHGQLLGQIYLHVPKGSLEAYKNNKDWNQYTDIIETDFDSTSE